MDPTSAVEEFGLVPEDNYSIPVEGIATLVCITLGLFYWFYYNVKDNSFPSPSSSNTNAASFREKRFASFVEHEISSYEMVLFVTKEDCATSYHALFDALQAPGHIVNLAQTACGSRVLEVLRESYSKEVSDIYLFVKGQLVGGTKEIQTFIVEGQKNEVGRNWDWGHIRIDPKMDTGFMILDEFNSFQCVNDVGNDKETIVKLETRPLVSVQELCTFNPANLVQCHIPIALHVRNQRRRSKLLVCHDMKGGYLGDRFKQGCNDFDAYRFYQWDLVDVFVYFGHALVCPPPCGWIAAGHRHGTRVLGTFLTEGEDGTERCKELFQNAQTAEAFAFKLAAIAWHGGFEGWLINIENDVPSDLIAHLKTFLHTLHNKLQLQNPLAQIVWYGSLSSLGKRSSYVRLDKCSTDFFQHVDGFYADYGWRSEDAKFSAAFDLDRRYDVYMGIDVFGRHNMLGGGKMNCSEPLRVVWNAGVSAALFAPGWSYECYQFEENEEFVVAEHRFWSAIRESWKVKSPCYDSLGGQNCFYTAFNVGRGNGVWLDGTCVGSSTWFNMTEMDVQPDHILHVGKVNVTATGSMKAVISHALAFQGGASVQLQGQLESKEKSYFKLYDMTPFVYSC
ncbi:cytosolic endo-beta-n-acetylglucosaminidase-like [Plasmopara halstedii]|uniref:Cytosolic endo-beta-n-acetylglucosaminidase-like n=1 Tax=Plasmopara halstedii TaxID=4781 RepID=A0A0N7L5D2_PLAHL|nr:cytosolic endo-beta-n-acetylglucosaminidase-like [Plasmopara halstedii]CEG41147.1 cytosolic endo-beta-n-acetylglucosaminidase-like [Plasmopara halstedii]|eukprot:XP_024577516.1 cytosolic endo-beta-n-acetylglucosaminidase-like [Plasmopara halstedii]